jgi:hypothetical protein
MTHPSPTTRTASSTRVHAGDAHLFPACPKHLPWPPGSALLGPALRQSHPTNSP